MHVSGLCAVLMPLVFCITMTGNVYLITLVTRYKEDAEIIRIECSDTGVGMSLEEVRDAFKPFFTTKNPGEGTGLGLYIAHEIVKRHGGNITIESKKGRGTAVSVEIPCQGSGER